MAELHTTTDVRLVTFVLNGEGYGVDVRRVREIINMVDISKTANTPSYVRGMINLRGSSVSVISLRSRFGMPELIDDEMSCIAIMEFNGDLAGFIFDDISDVVRIKREDVKPFLAAVSQPWIEGIINVGQKPGIFLNLQHLG